MTNIFNTNKKWMKSKKSYIITWLIVIKNIENKLIVTEQQSGKKKEREVVLLVT